MYNIIIMWRVGRLCKTTNTRQRIIVCHRRRQKYQRRCSPSGFLLPKHNDVTTAGRCAPPPSFLLLKKLLYRRRRKRRGDLFSYLARMLVARGFSLIIIFYVRTYYTHTYLYVILHAYNHIYYYKSWKYLYHIILCVALIPLFIYPWWCGCFDEVGLAVDMKY